jgi:3-deoxy-D-manno-octulosonic-acid transferase
VDVLPWVESFLDHWRPDLAVWTESELWPATLYATHLHGTPMLLINARISQRSFRRWRLARGMARALLGRFERILAQDELAAQQLGALGAEPGRLEVTGTLKEGAAPLTHDETERAAISRALGGRPIWLAASTHEGEEEVVAGAHVEVRRALPNLALILVPRHPVRGDAVAEMLRGRGFAVAQRSRGEALDADTEVYLGDTLGEMGLWYRIASVSFVGGSLVEVGGHNPFEPALLGSAILFGPHVRNFVDGYRRLSDAGAAVLVRTDTELAEALIATIAPDRAAEMAAAAWAACSEGAEVTDAVLDAVGALLDGKR